MAFADPPYNIRIDYGFGAAADDLSEKAYRDGCHAWLSQLQRIVRPGGAVWVLINEPNADMMGRAMNMEVGPRRNRIIWREAFSQYQEGKFSGSHRHLFYHITQQFMAQEPVITWNPDPIREPSKRMEAGDKRAAGPRVPDDCWDVSRLCGTFNERVPWHPAQLPQAPLTRIILCTTNPGDGERLEHPGSGSMAVVCKRLGRNYLGVDNNQDYVREANARVAAEPIEVV